MSTVYFHATIILFSGTFKSFPEELEIMFDKSSASFEDFHHCALSCYKFQGESRWLLENEEEITLDFKLSSSPLSSSFSVMLGTESNEFLI